jgi:hypothetical protein
MLFTHIYAVSDGHAPKVGQGSLGHNTLTLIADRGCAYRKFAILVGLAHDLSVARCAIGSKYHAASSPLAPAA